MRGAARRIGRLVAKELRQVLRDPRMKPMLFVAPILQLVLFGYAVNTDVRRVATFIVDHDQSADSRALIESLTASGYFRVTGRSGRPADLVRALDRGEAVVGLEIPAGFGQDLAAGRASAQLLVDGSDSNTGLVAQGHAARMIQDFASRRAAGPGTGTARPAVDLRARVWYNPSLASRVYNVPGVIAVLLMLLCLMLTSLAVVREREMGTLEQLMVSPLRPAELILGKTIPVALVALAQLVLVTSAALLWFQLPFRGSPAALLVGASLYILAGLAMGLLISTVSRTQQEAFMVMFLFFLPAIILSGFMYPVSSMPDVLQALSLGNPVRHFLVVVRAVFLKGAGVADLWREYLALAAIGGLTLGAAIARFSRSLA